MVGPRRTEDDPHWVGFVRSLEHAPDIGPDYEWQELEDQRGKYYQAVKKAATPDEEHKDVVEEEESA